MAITPRTSLKNKLITGETIVAPGAYDPMGARIIQDLGFSAIYTGGYMSGAHLAVTEPLMTMTEQLEVAGRVANSVNLPVIVDGNAGFGDPLHTRRTVLAYEMAGIAGIHIEDQVYPKRASYHKGLEHIVPIAEFIEKMSHALEARQNDDFVIIGRTDGFSAVGGSMGEAILRGKALRDLGVDVVMPRGVREKHDLIKYREEVIDVPLLVIAGSDDISVKEYEDMGYQIIIYAPTPVVATSRALEHTYRTLKETGLTGISASEVAARRTKIEELIDLPEYYRIEEQTTELDN